MIIVVCIVRRHGVAPVSRQQAVETARRALGVQFGSWYGDTNLLRYWHVAGVTLRPAHYFTPVTWVGTNEPDHRVMFLEFDTEGELLRK